MNSPTPAPVHPAARVAHILMALCLGIMAVAVFFIDPASMKLNQAA